MKTLLFALAVLLFYGCAASNQALLYRQQAKALDAKADLLGENVRKSIDLLISLRNNINVQGRSLTRKELDFAATASQLEERFLAWSALPSPKEGKMHRRRKNPFLFRKTG
ncbi:MAG: hypothetical protein IPH16_07630 [Haliscomenobacter sp.]|nr:hypothetical protein [Haliscomenobacter sp.]